MQQNKNESRHCHACSRAVESYWNFCPYCRAQLKDPIQRLTASQIQALRNGSESRNTDNR